jgi:hypothetical protein
MKRRLFALVLAVSLAGSVPASFAEGEGTAVGVNPDAIAKLQSTERVLQVGTDVSVGETIVTGPAGLVQILFDDQTKLVVGPGSSLKVETYLLASSNSAQQITIDALGGSFRFITGNSPKPAYSIRTPTAAIAVRGTEFDLIVERRSTRVMLYEGALQICNTSGQCEDLNKRCEVGYSAAQDVALFTTKNPERLPLSLEFRYARFQSPLLREFRVDGASKCAAEPQSGGSTESIFTAPEEEDDPRRSPNGRF